MNSSDNQPINYYMQHNVLIDTYECDRHANYVHNLHASKIYCVCYTGFHLFSLTKKEKPFLFACSPHAEPFFFVHTMNWLTVKKQFFAIKWRNKSQSVLVSIWTARFIHWYSETLNSSSKYLNCHTKMITRAWDHCTENNSFAFVWIPVICPDCSKEETVQLDCYVVIANQCPVVNRLFIAVTLVVHASIDFTLN